MELTHAIDGRRMVRAFSTEPLAPGLLDRLLERARRAPSAGNTQATSFLVLDQPTSVAGYWDTTLPSARRASFRWGELLNAPALVVITVRPSAYVDRYGESDKQRTGLGVDQDAWPVPYWWVDAGAVAQNLLLLALDAGLGACLFGLFEHESAVKTRFGVPSDERLVATIALGHPRPDTPGRSATRARLALSAVLHRNGWSTTHDQVASDSIR